MDGVDAIISAATGYSEADLQPFLRSIDLACPEAKLFLIVRRRDKKLVEHLSRTFGFIHPVYAGWKFNRGGLIFRTIARAVVADNFATRGRLWIALGRYPLHIMLERLFFALDLIRTHRHCFGKVLLTDSRDVIFQSDPFRFIDDNVVSGLEEETIGRCSINSSWLTDLYGNEVRESLSRKKIICSGVTMGPAGEIEKYLTEMCAEIWRCLPKVAMVGQYDQAIHNYLIYTGSVSAELTSNRDGIIATLHHEDPRNIQRDEATGAVIVQGNRPAIVHQYDRHRQLANLIRESLAA